MIKFFLFISGLFFSIINSSITCPHECGHPLYDYDVLKITNCIHQCLKATKLYEAHSLYYFCSLEKDLMEYKTPKEQLKIIQWQSEFHKNHYEDKCDYYLFESTENGYECCSYLDTLELLSDIQKDIQSIYQYETQYFLGKIHYYHHEINALKIQVFRPDFGISLKQAIETNNNWIKTYTNAIIKTKNQYQKNLDIVSKCESQVTDFYLQLFNWCIQNHEHIESYYQRGLLYFSRGQSFDSLKDIHHLLRNRSDDLDLHVVNGKNLIELGNYHEAIDALSYVIAKDPKNIDAHFERAVAYFETGEFDLSLKDYLESKIKFKEISKDLLSFSQGLLHGILEGGSQATVEFVPSILSSLHGISQGLWAFVLEPRQVSVELINSAKGCIDFLKVHTTKETFHLLVPELKELMEKWEQIDELKQGILIGNIIGKYGIDIFAGVGVTKGMKVYRDLKRANNLLTFEAMSLNNANKKLLELEAIKKAKARKEILKYSNLEIDFDKQGRHIKEYKNFDKYRSELTIANPQELIHKYAGTGQKINNNIPGKPGYKERVDFKQTIGIYKDQSETIAQETTMGMIIYSNKGTHIVPVRPKNL